MVSSLSLLLVLAFLAASLRAHYTDALDSTEQTDSGQLIFTHVIFRHGDRTPIDPYPNDPWAKREYWHTGWGQLTNIGKQQHYELGQWLRKRYGKLISPTYALEEIYIRSTDVDRTLMSALSDLAGLYPPQGDQVWNKDLQWQPIPVHTVAEKDDILMGKAPCPAFDKAYKNLMQTSEFQILNNRFQYLYDYLSKYSGRKVGTLENIQFLNNTLYIEDLYKRKLPDWTKKVFPSADMTYASNFAFAVNTYTRQMARFKSGPLLKEILERMTEKVQGKLKPGRSMWIYSGHDTTVANFLNSLKLFDIHSPPYRACIMLELRVDANQNPFVSIFYKNTTAEPAPMNIPGCGTSCPLSSMFDLYKDILPQNWHQECKVANYEDADMGLALAILVTIVTVMLFLSYVSMLYYRRRNYRNHYTYSQVA